MLEDHYVTGSGRKVLLQIFSKKGHEERCLWAMESLKRAMKWDEDTFGLE
jgi:aminopeptidase N